MKVINMTEKISHYDIADHLGIREEMALYLDACIEEADGDVTFIAKALDDIARSCRMIKNS